MVVLLLMLLTTLEFVGAGLARGGLIGEEEAGGTLYNERKEKDEEVECAV